ncbi:MAG: TolC family protein [Bacteroidales bacterium]|nr:TolC family protein [Bacteroidales bacterium]
MMKIKSYTKLMMAFIGIFSWFIANGQKLPDSLDQYLAIAAKNNPAVLQKFYEYQAAMQKAPQVGSLPDPELTLGVLVKPMELVNGKQVADIRLMQMFPWFGTLRAAKDEMSLMANAKFESFRDAKLQVYFDVKRNWYELQKVKENIQISERNVEILKVIERLTLVKFKAMPSGGNSSSSGGSGLADLYRIQIDIGDLENNIVLLKTQQISIEARFNAFLNRPSEMKVYLPETILAESPDISITTLTDSMFMHNPMLEMLLYEQKSLEARKKMVTLMGYPMIGLGVNYSVNSKNSMSGSPMNGKDMIMPMATITLPIYRGKYNAMKFEAELLRSASEQDYQSTSNTLNTEYYEAIQLFTDGQRRITLYDSQSDLTKKTLDIMLKNFTTGGTSLTDILRIRQQLLDYEFKQTEALTDYNTAIAWLQRLIASSSIQEK